MPNDYIGYDISRMNQNPYYSPYMPGPDWASGTAGVYSAWEQQRQKEQQRRDILGQQEWERQLRSRQMSLQEEEAKTKKGLTQAQIKAVEAKPSGVNVPFAKSLLKYHGYGPDITDKIDENTDPATIKDLADRAVTSKTALDVAKLNALNRFTSRTQTGVNLQIMRHLSYYKSMKQALQADLKKYENGLIPNPTEITRINQQLSQLNAAEIHTMRIADGMKGGQMTPEQINEIGDYLEKSDPYQQYGQPRQDPTQGQDVVGGDMMQRLGMIFGGGAPAPQETPQITQAQATIPPDVLAAAKKKYPKMSDAEIVNQWLMSHKR